MSKPKGHSTKRRTGNRRSHHALKPVQTTVCQKCKQEVMPHRVCRVCGTYNKRQVLNMDKEIEKTLAKSAKKEKKQETKES